MWAYILAVLSREENHDVLVVATVGDACRDEFQVGVVVDRRNELSGGVEREKSRVMDRECSQIVGRCTSRVAQRRRLLSYMYQS
jgi:hypothetical protein